MSDVVHDRSSGKIYAENCNYAYASTTFGVPEYPLTQEPNRELNKTNSNIIISILIRNKLKVINGSILLDVISGGI